MSGNRRQKSQAPRHLWMLTALLLFGFVANGGDCLRNVSLLINPQAVQRGHLATLVCQYDIENANLYSVQWYRGNYEFYRYSPGGYHKRKIFPHKEIHVDMSVSNATQVRLRDVGFKLSGNFSCEVTVEDPVSTKIVHANMLVVSLPGSAPKIETDRERYSVGEILNATCTSPPSKPPASISFLLNNQPVGDPDVQYIPEADSLQSSVLSLRLYLNQDHYVNGQLVLKCTAYITTLYRNSSEKQLGAGNRDPIPERVTLPNSAVPSRTSWMCWLLAAVSFWVASDFRPRRRHSER